MIQDLKKHLPSAFISVAILIFIKFNIFERSNSGFIIFGLTVKKQKNYYFLVGFFLINLISVLITRILLLKLFTKGIPRTSKLN